MYTRYCKRFTKYDIDNVLTPHEINGGQFINPQKSPIREP